MLRRVDDELPLAARGACALGPRVLDDGGAQVRVVGAILAVLVVEVLGGARRVVIVLPPGTRRNTGFVFRDDPPKGRRGVAGRRVAALRCK